VYADLGATSNNSQGRMQMGQYAHSGMGTAVNSSRPPGIGEASKELTLCEPLDWAIEKGM